MFDRPVDLEIPNTLRNLSELAATKTLIETFKKAINALTVPGQRRRRNRDSIKLRQTRPFVAKEQGYLIPKKSVFNRIIGDRIFELFFARFLEDYPKMSYYYAKNYLAVHTQAGLRLTRAATSFNYYPDFLVKLADKRVVVVEIKGHEDLDVPLKMRRLRLWCEDINRVQEGVQYDFVYVDQASFERYKPLRRSGI